MIHYHGCPITPERAAVSILAGRHAMVSFAHPEQVEIAAEACQSFVLDNGAFSAWMQGRPTDWPGYYDWCREWLKHPACDWAIIPDTIDGNEADNRALVQEWQNQGFHDYQGVPVYHLHESFRYLDWLCAERPRIAIGSSGEWATPGKDRWWERMHEVFDYLDRSSRLRAVKVHGLRMLDPEIFQRLPLASADSTNVARNIGIDQRWRGTYQPPDKGWRGHIIAARIEAHQSAASYRPGERYRSLFVEDQGEGVRSLFAIPHRPPPARDDEHEKAGVAVAG